MTENIANYVPTRRGATLRDRLNELARAARVLTRGGGLGYATRCAAQALGLRGPRYIQADGTRTWGSQGRPVSGRKHLRIERNMAQR